MPFAGFELEIANIAAKTIFAIGYLYLLTRILGKKQISQLTYFDYVIGISIGSIAGVAAIDPKINYLHGMLSLSIWAAFPLVFSFISLKSVRGRKLIDGVPRILVQNGKIVEVNMHKERFNMNDLLEQLREKGAFNIQDVQYAILENDGELSVMLKPEKQPLTPYNLNLFVPYQGLVANLIVDGEIMPAPLAKVGKNEEWLISELNRLNIKKKDILLASLDASGQLHLDLKFCDPPVFQVFE